jgi:hypothetical protein
LVTTQAALQLLQVCGGQRRMADLVWCRDDGHPAHTSNVASISPKWAYSDVKDKTITDVSKFLADAVTGKGLICEGLIITVPPGTINEIFYFF